VSRALTVVAGAGLTCRCTGYVNIVEVVAAGRDAS
jgi:aerobic-type carbon monoxide dehydrogenase small subunit (CoxS/CutS family)